MPLNNDEFCLTVDDFFVTTAPPRFYDISVESPDDYKEENKKLFKALTDASKELAKLGFLNNSKDVDIYNYFIKNAEESKDEKS